MPLPYWVIRWLRPVSDHPSAAAGSATVRSATARSATAGPAPAGPAVAVAGLAVTSALGRGVEAQLPAVLAGVPAFTPVGRFDVTGRRVRMAATLPDVAELPVELAVAIADACTDAGLGRPERASTPLFLAVHGGSEVPALATGLAEAAGLAGVRRIYTAACVSGTTAVSDAATLIRTGSIDRAVVAAGYLVEPDQYALFDAGRALSADGAVRPFSRDRHGLLLGDAVVAVVLESAASMDRRDHRPIATLAGWSRAGDGHHPVQPAPDGRGLARAIIAALAQAGIGAESLGYINANASGAALTDAAEAAGLALALGPAAATIPISSTKSVHGHALEASGLLEFAITVLSLAEGKLGVNAGYLGPDADLHLDVITDGPRQLSRPYAMTLNCAFGGANTALIVSTEPAAARPRPRFGPVELVGQARWLVAVDGEPPVVPGFIHSSFSPLVAAAADRLLTDFYLDPTGSASNRERTAIVLVSRAGDQVSAAEVRRIVAGGHRPGPLFFFQSVPNSIAGHLAAHWGLGGPVVCLSPVADPIREGRDAAALLLSDGEVEHVLVVVVEQSPDAPETEFAHALLFTNHQDESGKSA